MTTQRAIGLETSVVRADDLLSSVIDDEVMMLNIITEKYHSLDGVGARIWELLDQPRRISEICSQLLEEYDVDRPACEDDVLQFVRTLIDARLVQTVEP